MTYKLASSFLMVSFYHETPRPPKHISHETLDTKNETNNLRGLEKNVWIKYNTIEKPFTQEIYQLTEEEIALFRLDKVISNNAIVTDHRRLHKFAFSQSRIVVE